jgi:GNAT superfamily N-acetyltransferase
MGFSLVRRQPRGKRRPALAQNSGKPCFQCMPWFTFSCALQHLLHLCLLISILVSIMTDSFHDTEQGIVRRLLPFDSAQFRGHLKRFDEDSRRLRFGAVVSDSFLDNYADSSYRFDTVIFGWFVDGVMRAAGELRPISLGPSGSAEIAFSVEKPYQHHGIGSMLMDRIVVAARNRAIGHLRVFCLPGNEPMKHLADKYGAHMHASHGEVEGDITPEPATALTLLGESVQEAHGLLSAFIAQAGRWTEGTHR